MLLRQKTPTEWEILQEEQRNRLVMAGRSPQVTTNLSFTVTPYTKTGKKGQLPALNTWFSAPNPPGHGPNCHGGPKTQRRAAEPRADLKQVAHEAASSPQSLPTSCPADSNSPFDADEQGGSKLSGEKCCLLKLAAAGAAPRGVPGA